MVDLEAFQLAADFGMLEYNRLLADQVRDQGTAMATGLKLQGAMEFLQIMRMLSENPKLPPRAQMGDNLDHTV